MIYDFERDVCPLDRKFDVCIVGAGAAGLSLARKLISAGRDVLLIDGGGRSRWERKSQSLNKTRNIGHVFSGAHSGRFRALGGTTSAWAGQVMELDELDFESRPWIGDISWPISKDTLKSYYRAAEVLEGTGELLSDDQIWESNGLQEPDFGDDLHMAFSRYCPERKFSRLFSDMFDDEKLTIVMHANAVELVSLADRVSINHVTIRSLNGRSASCKATTFALCLGGIESSRFLLNQKFAPWNGSGLVGKNFQDHVHCFSADIDGAELNIAGWAFGPSRLNGQYLPKIKLTEEAQKRHGVLNASGMVEFSDGNFSTLRTGIKIVAGPTSTVGVGEFLKMLPRVPAAMWHHFKIKKDPGYVVPWAKLKLTVCCEQSPDSASSISLTSERDKVGLFRAAVNWKISDLEIKTIRTYTDLVKKAFERHRIARVTPVPELSSDRIQGLLTDQFHHCGGTRMARKPENGVVEENLRLFGVSNAYVCSSSVFPTSGFANPTHTLVALAIRLADHLNSTHIS